MQTSAPAQVSTQAQAIAPDALLNLTAEQRRCFLLLRAALYESRTAFQMIARDREQEGGSGSDLLSLSSATAFAVRQAARKSEEVNDQTVTATLYAYFAEAPTCDDSGTFPSVAPARPAPPERKVWTFDPTTVNSTETTKARTGAGAVANR